LTFHILFYSASVPEPPTVDAVISRYSYLTGITTGFIVKFSEVVSFNEVQSLQ
jgi:hypothetical protein